MSHANESPTSEAPNAAATKAAARSRNLAMTTLRTISNTIASPLGAR
jgi:hypothetical protein